MIPPIPTNLTLTILSPYQIKVQVDPQVPVCNFRAFREVNESGIFANVNSGYPQGFFVDSFQILPATEFCYKVQAYNTNGASDFTPVVMATTPLGDLPNQNPTPVPSGLIATPSGTTIALSWVLGDFIGVSGQGQLVQVQRSTDGVTYRVINSFLNRATMTDASVQPGVLYYYKVRTQNNFGWGTWSDFSNVATVQL